MKSSVNIRLFRNSSILVRISLAPYKYVPIYMCIVKDTYYIRIRICAQQLKYMKVRRKLKNEVCCVLFTVHQFPWGSGNVLFFCSSYPHASQVCCDTHYSSRILQQHSCSLAQIIPRSGKWTIIVSIVNAIGKHRVKKKRTGLIGWFCSHMFKERAN